MKKLIYIIILAAFYSCSLFSQPDTLEYYSKSWGDSMKIELAKRDTAIMIMAKNSLNMDIESDTAYWKDKTTNYDIEVKQENQLFEGRVKLQNDKEVIFLYVAGKVNTRIMTGDTVATQYNIDLRQLK